LVLRDSQNNLSAEAQAEMLKLRAEIAKLKEELSEAQSTIKKQNSRHSPSSLDTLQLLRDLPIFLWVKDRQNNVIFVSKKGSEVIGVTPEEMEGRSSYELYPDEALGYFKHDLEVMETGQPKLAIIEVLSTESGEKIWVSTDKYPWRDQNDEIVGVIVLSHDVTERIERLGQAPHKLINMDLSLMEAEERFYLAYQGSKDGLWDLHMDGKKPFVSARCKEIVGFKDHEIGDDFFQWMERIHPEDREMNRTALISHFKNKTPYNVEFRFKNKSGHYRWISCLGQAQWDEDGHVVRMCGSIRDVTDRKITEQILRTQYDLSTALNGVHDFSSFKTVCRAIGNSIDWTDGALWLVAANGDLQVKFHFGEQVELYKMKIDSESKDLLKNCIAKDEIFAGHTDRETNSGERLKFAARLGLGHQLIVPMRSGNRVFGAFELFHKDPREYREDLRQWTKMLGNQLGGVVGRILAQQELAERDLRLSSIVDGAPDGIITLTEGSISSANHAAHEMFGFEHDELIGLGAEDVMPGMLLRVAENAMSADSAKEENLSHRFEIQARKKNGDILPIEASISVFTISDTLHLTVIIRDISERKEVEKRVSEFYSMVSHELRTPLTSIRGSFGLMEGGLAGELSPMASKLVSVGRIEVDRLIRLINDILDIRKIQAGRIDLKMTSLSAAQLLTDAVEVIAPIAAASSIKIITKCDENTTFFGDRDRILQVMTNILSNAIKYSNTDDSVLIAVEGFEDKTRCAVTDNGPGIPLDKHGELFVPFHQLESGDTRPHGGTGLGLAISKAIVTHHGGTIGVDSQEGHGATFWFEIPT
jgi:PAS domain S-box-containing protein